MTNDNFALTENIYNRLGFLIRRVHQMSLSVFSEECAALSLTPAQYGILLVVRHGPAGIDQTRVAEALGQDRATTGQTLRGLEQRGLVQRKPSVHDPRSKALTLTPEGVAVVDRASEMTPIVQQRLLSALTPEEGLTLMNLLHKLAESSNAVSRTRLALLAPAKPAGVKLRTATTARSAANSSSVPDPKAVSVAQGKAAVKTASASRNSPARKRVVR
jgi:DNA-binding MarR family transcriptional regulator